MTKPQQKAIDSLRNETTEVVIVDTNFNDEPIVYSHVKGSKEIREYVISKFGVLDNTAIHAYDLETSALMKNSESA